MFDKFKKSADELKDKLADQVDKHESQINAGLDKAGSFVDQRTGGKYADKIAAGKDKVRSGLDKLDNDPDGAGPESTPGGPTPTP